MASREQELERSETVRLSKAALFVVVVASVVLADQATKWLVQSTLTLYEQVDIIGDYVRLTYIYNPGAAFGLHVGEYSRYVFLALTVVALVVLFAWYRSTPASDTSSAHILHRGRTSNGS